MNKKWEMSFDLNCLLYTKQVYIVDFLVMYYQDKLDIFYSLEQY